MRFTSQMFTCPKCGKKIKTMYERVFGEKPHYEPAGYRCETCKIFYDVDAKTSRIVSGVAKIESVGVRQEVADEQERMRLLHKPHAIDAQNACANVGLDSMSSSSNAMRENGWGEIRTLDHLRVRQVS
jgi:hypothetical protein